MFLLSSVLWIKIIAFVLQIADIYVCTVFPKFFLSIPSLACLLSSFKVFPDYC